jgi:hypothetical protein
MELSRKYTNLSLKRDKDSFEMFFDYEYNGMPKFMNENTKNSSTEGNELIWNTSYVTQDLYIGCLGAGNKTFILLNSPDSSKSIFEKSILVSVMRTTSDPSLKEMQNNISPNGSPFKPELCRPLTEYKENR